MITLSDVEREAMRLPECSRASLASHLLDSLSAVLADADEGIAEALRRDIELDQDPAAGLTLEELRQNFRP